MSLNSANVYLVTSSHMTLCFKTSKTKMGMVPSLPSNNLYYINYLNMIEWNKYHLEEHVICGILEQLHDWSINERLNKRGDT